MCGLIGYLNQPANLDMAQRLLIAGGMRGRDATGFLEIDLLGRMSVTKRAVDPETFTEDMTFVHKTHSFFLGHTRYATCGNKDADEQAQPFHGRRYVVFHNGYLSPSDWQYLEYKFKIKPDHGVDSELFLKYLEKNQSIERLRDEFLPCIRGARKSAYGARASSKFMLIIYDKYTRDIHFLKCPNQDFHYIIREEGIIYGSTPTILQVALNLTDQEVIDQVIKFPELAHYKWNIQKGLQVEKYEIPPTKTVELDDAKQYLSKGGFVDFIGVNYEKKRRNRKKAGRNHSSVTGKKVSSKDSSTSSSTVHLSSQPNQKKKAGISE